MYHDDDEYLDHDANTPLCPGLHPGLVLDFSQLYLGAQSSGSHVAVEFLKQRGDCQDVQVGQNEEMWQICICKLEINLFH